MFPCALGSAGLIKKIMRAALLSGLREGAEVFPEELAEGWVFWAVAC